MRDTRPKASPDANASVAIIGMACRFPGASSPDEFWRLLVERRDSVGEYPPGRSAGMDGYYAAVGKEGGPKTARCGTLAQLKEFDAEFFGISPREAALIDPHQRLLLELGWEAFEDAGVLRSQFEKSDTGVYVGAWAMDYLRLMHGGEGATVLGQNGGGQHSTSGRLAFVLDLRGPDVATNMSCASGLAAVHLACEGLRAGECGMALAGGANVILEPDVTTAFTNGGVLSPEGRCKFGDAGADGFVRSEGAGVFVLKLLEKALDDGDRIHAVIRGSALVNSGGSSGSLTRPSQLAQTEVLRKACKAAGVSPAQLEYVEAHGTGTAVGDPIEISALSEVVGKAAGRATACVIGSAKSNIGHTESASGIAGMIKTVLAMRFRYIPASLHVRQLNPKVDWAASGLRLETAGCAWPKSDRPRLAGVSSFGLTGTNAHLILQEAPEIDCSRTKLDTWIFPVTAHSDAALRQLAGSWMERLRHGGELANLCFTASTRRTALEHRLCLTGKNAEGLAASIEEWLRGERPEAVHYGVAKGDAKQCVFVFPGQGAQWAGMGRELFRDQQVFRETLEACDAAIQKETGWSVVSRLFSDESASELDDVAFVQPALFAIQVALARLWGSRGVVPDTVVGHSMGEVAAAHIAGALSLADATAVICRRSKLLKRLSGQGAMALLELTMQEAETAVYGTGGSISVAASNGQRATVVSGNFSEVMALVSQLEREAVFCRVIKVDVASHSPQMDPLLAELEVALQGIRPTRADLPIFSTVLGKKITGEEMDAAYWGRNLREPVLFYPAVKNLLAQGAGEFLEMSPHPTLSSYVQAAGEERATPAAALSSLRRNEPELASLFESLSELFVRGYSINWKAIYPAGTPVTLPQFPWQREMFWLEETAGRPAYHEVVGHPLLGELVVSAAGDSTWTNAALGQSTWLQDHVVGTSVLVPASLYVEMGLEAGRKAAQGQFFHLERLFVREAMFLSAAAPVEIQTLVVAKLLGEHALRFYIRTTGDVLQSPAWTLAATGSITVSQQAESAVESAQIDPAQFLRLQRGEKIVDGRQHREEMARRGYHFGPSFLCLDSYLLRDRDAFGRARISAGMDAAETGSHAVLFDAGLQLLAALCYAGGFSHGQLLPVRLGRVQAFESKRALEGVLIQASVSDQNWTGGDLLFYDTDGGLVMKVTGVLFKNVEKDEASSLAGMMYSVEWESLARRQQDKVDEPGIWVVLADDGKLGVELAAALRRRGVHVEVIAPAVPTDPPGVTIEQRTLDAIAEETAVGLVDLRGCDLALSAQSDGAAKNCAQIADLVRLLGKAGINGRLALVTQSAEAIPGDFAALSIGQAAISGLAAVISNEHPELQCASIDLPYRANPSDISELAEELLSPHGEGRIALRGERKWVARLKPILAELSNTATQRVQAESFRLEQRIAGHLDSLRLVESDRRAPGEAEIEIRVQAAGLNFRDVMQAMGLFEDPSGDTFGMGLEAAGVVTHVGARVTDFRAGDEVMAISSGTQGNTLFASHAVVSAELTVRKSVGLAMAEAAALPGAYLTAYYALVRLAHLRKGERVLIHAAAGGVGLAAVQIAKWMGAEIFATAGSEEKRDYLRQLGIAHVMDSRSSGFGSYIARMTGGAGVDVVLNSLAGEAVMEGMRALAAYGRFVEIGKRDMWRDSAMGIAAFSRNRSFIGFDLATMTEDRPEIVGSLLREVASLIDEGSLRALPVKIFGVSQAVEAFRFMAEARQIGKVVLDMEDAVVRVETMPKPVKADSTYLITGGTGALGIESAKELFELGARHFVLTSRAEPSRRTSEDIAALEAKGAEVCIRRLDVSNEQQMCSLLEEISGTMPCLRGVIHAAGVLDDATVENLDRAKFDTAMAAKSHGAFLLDRLTEKTPLDFFVLYSSIAGLLGSPGQGNYAAANAMLDALAHDRKRRGLPATSINWGPWSDLGLAAQESNRGARLADRGLPSISPIEGRMLLRQVLQDPNALPCQVVMAKVDRGAWLAYVPAAGASQFLSCLPQEQMFAQAGVRQDVTGKSGHLADRLRSMGAEEGREALLDHLREQTAMVVRMKPIQIALNKPFRSLGIDSLMGVELRQRLEKSLGIRLSSSVIWNYPSVADLGEHLAQMLGIGKRPAGTAMESSARREAEVEEETHGTELTAMAMLSMEIMEAEDLLGRT